jgi:prevent-host-death family protein
MDLTKTVSINQVRRNYKQVVEQADNQPIVVISNNKPQFVITSLEWLRVHEACGYKVGPKL